MKYDQIIRNHLEVRRDATSKELLDLYSEETFTLFDDCGIFIGDVILIAVDNARRRAVVVGGYYDDSGNTILMALTPINGKKHIVNVRWLKSNVTDN